MNDIIRGSRTDYEAIWELPIATRIDGKMVESFCLDASGLLVYRSGDNGDRNALIPFASQAWAVDSILLGRLESEIRKKLSNPFCPALANELYPRGIPQLRDLYAGKGSLYAEPKLLRSAIDAFQEGDAEVREEIVSELANFGLFPFFSIENLSPAYFEVIGQELTKGKVCEPGWMNHDSVFVKAKIM